MLQETDVSRDHVNRIRYKELFKTAMLAENYEEAIQYCHKILELDPNNVESWINKAKSTFLLTTGSHNRYAEAMEYLHKVAQISPNNPRIAEVQI